MQRQTEAEQRRTERQREEESEEVSRCSHLLLLFFFSDSICFNVHIKNEREQYDYFTEPIQ